VEALSGLLTDPIAQLQVFFDFSAFVAVFVGLLGPAISVVEGMFTVTYGFGNNVQRFRHIQLSFLKVTLAYTVPSSGNPILHPAGLELAPNR
jgi:hypothetical protein